MESGRIANPRLKLIIEARKADHKASVERWRMENLVSPDSKRFGLHPLEIFPKLVWELIFERLTDPAAIAGAWNASTFFQEIIGRDKYFSHSLFPRVLSLKPLKQALQFLERDESRCYPKYRTGCCLPKLRLVSKTWKEGVDQLVIREIEEYNAWRWTNEHYSWIPFFQMTSDVMEKQLRDASLENMGNGQKSASISIVNHSLDLTPSYPYTDREFVQGFLFKLNRFLEAFGGDVLGLLLTTTKCWARVSGLTAREYYLMIRTWISHTPRLQRLGLDLLPFHCFDRVFKFRQPDAELLEVQEAIRSHPFPCLNSLRSLALKGTPLLEEKFMLALYTAILNSSKQIEHLEIELQSVVDDKLELNDPLRAAVHALENLQSLVVCRYEHYTDPTPCFNFNWKLKRLSLEYGVTRRSRLFRLLENYPTLEWLHLDLMLNEESRFDSPFLHLPNVTTVVLSVIIDGWLMDLINIDFLFPMKKLSVLKWKDYGLDCFDFAKNELIQFQGGQCDLYRSNIWEVFPSLSFCLIEIEGPSSSEKVYKRGLRVCNVVHLESETNNFSFEN